MTGLLERRRLASYSALRTHHSVNVGTGMVGVMRIYLPIRGRGRSSSRGCPLHGWVPRPRQSGKSTSTHSAARMARRTSGKASVLAASLHLAATDDFPPLIFISKLARRAWCGYKGGNMARHRFPCMAIVLMVFCGWSFSQEASKPTAGPDRTQVFDNRSVGDLERFLKERGYASIPLERNHAGSIVVVVTVGETKLRLVCDTGATLSMLDEKRTKDLRIAWEKSDFDVSIGDSDFARSCKIEVMELSAFKVHGIRFHSFDTTNGNKRLEQYKDTPIDGLLGWDVLKDYSAIIDVRALRLYLRNRH